MREQDTWELPAIPDTADVVLHPLLRRRRHAGCPPVLLIHGASAHSGTFDIPTPSEGRARSLSDWLYEHGYEPWLLDWRGSARVVEQCTARDDRALARARHALHMDGAASHEIPAALRKIREIRCDESDPPRSIAAVAHCLGGAALCQSIAAGLLPRAESHEGFGPPLLTHLVLSTVGLFFTAPPMGQLKVQDGIVQRLWESGEHSIDPRDRSSWPAEYRRMFENWPRPLRTHLGAGSESEVCNNLSFMYGRPYLEKSLVPEIHRATTLLEVDHLTWHPDRGETIHAEDSRKSARLDEVRSTTRDGRAVLVLTDVASRFAQGDALLCRNRVFARARDELESHPSQLSEQFGPIPLRIYLQAARSLRRGFAAPLGADDGQSSSALIGPAARARFDEISKITLITGAKNQLWHRGSIDRMYEWLMRGRRRDVPPEKHVLADYGHQDLFWGRRASTDVFPIIAGGLPG